MPSLPELAPRGPSPRPDPGPPPTRAPGTTTSASPPPAKSVRFPKRPSPFALPANLPASFTQARPVDILALIPAPYAFPAVQLALRVVASVLDPLLHSTADASAVAHRELLHVGYVPPPLAPAFCGYATFALSPPALSRALYLLALIWEAAFRFSQTCEAIALAAAPVAPTRGRKGPPRPPAAALRQLEVDLGVVALEADKPLSPDTAVNLQQNKDVVHICRYDKQL